MKSPVTGDAAKSNDPNTWSSFEDALNYMDAFGMDGIAFALDRGVEFIDLDHIVDKTSGKITNETAIKLLAELPETYAELSASGTGIHIFCLGQHPTNARNRNDESGIEMYDHERFACFTGKVYDNRRKLLDYSDIISDLAYRYVGLHPTPIKSYVHTVSTVSGDDRGLLDKILASRQAEKFRELYSGAINRYESHSQADSALVWILAFWTRDRSQIDRVFRSSGLYREKWDRRLYNTTYGESMIDSALQSVRPHKELEAY